MITKKVPEDGGMGADLKILKSLFFFIAALILAGCMGVLVCVFNPSLTAMLAEKVEEMGPARSGGLEAGILSRDDETGGILPGIDTGWVEGLDQTGYEIPAGESVEAPPSVSGRTGYEPVQEEAEQIAQDEAEHLSESADVGNTGDGLTFAEEYYPYYAMLEADMQKLYRQIYANAMELNKSFAPAAPVSVNRLKTVFEAVYNDHPELFWLETGYSCKYLRDGGCVEITLKFNATADYLDEAKQNFERSAARMLSGTENLESDLEKERQVHDRMTEAVEYALNAPMNQSAYSALAEGQSVCAGYARAFQYLMQQLGIPCYYCTGFAGEDHAWNIVRIDGHFYNVDVTWDDTETATYDYFNRSDAEFGSTHMRTGLSVYLPACVTEGEADPAPGDDAEGEVPDLSGYTAADLINPNPIKPLTWEDIQWPEESEDNPESGEREDIGPEESETGGGEADPEEREDREEEDEEPDREEQERLERAGITADEVRETMEEYYEDCRKLLTEAGTGDRQFVNVIPESLWDSVERAYSSGAYWEGYAEDALEDLGADNLVIQIQAAGIGGGYYRLYHNVYTY